MNYFLSLAPQFFCERSRNRVIKDALKQYIEQQARYVEGVAQARASLERGEGIAHADLMHEMDALIEEQKRIKQPVVLLRENPQIGRPGRVPGTRELVVSGTSYIAPYQILEKRAEFLRVYQTARRPPENFR